MPEVESFLADMDIDNNIRESISGLVWLNGGTEVLDQAREKFKNNADVMAALEEVTHVAEQVSNQRPDLQLHFDFAELRGFHYHTGVVFAAYQKGQGRAIAQGGRYDDIGKIFGRARPATGFSADLRALATLGENRIAQSGGIFAPANSLSKESGKALTEKINELRSAGERVVCELSGQTGGANEAGCDRILVYSGGQWVVKENK
jgi:ATP phosphoribosyltransferase regulatory subunit